MLRNRYTCLSRSSVVSRPSVETVSRAGRGGESPGIIKCIGLRTEIASSGCVKCDCIGDCLIYSREPESLVDRFGCQLIARKILDGSGDAVTLSCVPGSAVMVPMKVSTFEVTSVLR